MFKERWYQRRSVKKTIEHIEKGLHPCTVLPTGSGKTIVICNLVEKYLDKYIENDVLIISHRRKILEQDHLQLCNHFPDFEIGLYSSGLKTRTKTKITVAGIQSIWRKPELFQNVGLVIIDEAHLINHKADGMYRNFLKKIPAQYVGLTATPFRLGHGYIYKGEDTLFNSLAYDMSSTENYNKLVSQGYLSPMFSRKTKFLVDTSDIKKRGGEFDPKSSRIKFDREGITDIACNEMIRTANENKLEKWLIFAIDIEHAEHISEKMTELRIKCACIHSKMKNEKEILDDYRLGKYKCIVNVDILTTGLDIPDIDLIGVLRPTNSPSLHVQILGRGGRPVYANGFDLTKKKERIKAISSGKKPFCMVLDFAGNVNRLGPINSVTIEEKNNEKNSGSGNAVTKFCPKCETIAYAAAKKCDCCGHKFEFKQKILTESSDLEIISSGKKEIKEIEEWHKVDLVVYNVHCLPGKISSLKVSYYCNGRRFIEFICIDHKGIARHIANKWIRDRIRHGIKKPVNLSELFKIKNELRVPVKIRVKKNKGYMNVINWQF